MKKTLSVWLPFVIAPVFIPVYVFLDNFIFVEIFGCGCVPGAQTNMLNIPFNANDLRLAVFSVLTIILTAFGVAVSKNFGNKTAGIFYCSGAFLFNVFIIFVVQKTMMWT